LRIWTSRGDTEARSGAGAYESSVPGLTDPNLYPYILDPKLAPAIWGGSELVTEFDKHGDPNAKLGESWECWDANAVTDGPLL
jgi:hypothetical protein